MSRYKLDIFVVENFNIRQLDQCIQKPSHVLDRKKKKKNQTISGYLIYSVEIEYGLIPL